MALTNTRRRSLAFVIPRVDVSSGRARGKIAGHDLGHLSPPRFGLARGRMARPSLTRGPGGSRLLWRVGGGLFHHWDGGGGEEGLLGMHGSVGLSRLRAPDPTKARCMGRANTIREDPADQEALGAVLMIGRSLGGEHRTRIEDKELS